MLWPGCRRPAAERLLAEIALEGDNEEIRLTAVDHLKAINSATARGQFIAALSAGDNTKINRAGVALGELGDKAAIGPMIGRSSASTSRKSSRAAPARSAHRLTAAAASVSAQAARRSSCGTTCRTAGSMKG